MFSYPLKFILGFSRIFTFLTINQNIHTQLCMNVKIHHCHTLNWADQFFSFKFVSSTCHLQKVTPQKS
jgi:hypothetical protein